MPNPGWKYSHCCYNAMTTYRGYPHGFCRKCWIKHGKPQPMKKMQNVYIRRVKWWFRRWFRNG